MGIREDLKSILAKEAITMKKLTEILTENGKKTSYKGLSNKLKNNTIKFEDVRYILNVLDYEIEYKKNVKY